MSFFPSSSYLRKLIRATEERLAFLESDELLQKNSARKEDILRAKSELKTDIVRLEQDLKLSEDALVAKVPTPATKRIPFNEWSQERLLLSSKSATSRTSQYGKIGDTFQAGDKTFELTDVSKKSLGDIAQNYYLDEGAKSPEEFIEVWNSLHPKGFDPKQVVYFHKFRELTPGLVRLKGLLSKPSLTQEESREAVALAQTIYKTESRKVLTARENIALNTQVRKNLAESYRQLVQEGEIKSSRIVGFRKRQLEEELNVLSEIARKTEIPEIPPLSPLTDKHFARKPDAASPFFTYSLAPKAWRPGAIYQYFGFGQWFEGTDELLRMKPQGTSKKAGTFYADYELWAEEFFGKRLPQAAISRGKQPSIGQDRVILPEVIEGMPYPEAFQNYLSYDPGRPSVNPKTLSETPFLIKGTLRKGLTEEEARVLAKASRKEEEKRVIEEAKRLYTKPGGKLEYRDLWEPYIKDGELRYKLAFFRTEEGGIAYAGDNPNIMLESRLSQAAPETSFSELSFYDSEKIKKMIVERAKAYDKEQYDQDIILSNRGLPIKDADKLRRDTERFEQSFVMHFMINHPDQLKPWLEAADPKTIRYLNDVLGGEEMLRRKWLPQIELEGKLVDITEKRVPGLDAFTEIGWSPAKIKSAVEGTLPDRSRNTVIYVVDKDVPRNPNEYAAFVEKLRTGKEPYRAKICEEIDVGVRETPEPGLGMSVSTDILDLLKPGDVPEGVRVSSPLVKTNDIRVVRYVPPLKDIAGYKPLHEAWEGGMTTIARQTEAIKAKYPGSVQGTVTYIDNAPSRFGAAQEGVIVTEDGTDIQFITYKKDSPPVLRKNQRYTLKNPAETIEGSEIIARVTRDNIEEARFPSEQISTRGIVIDVFDVNNPKGVAQYGYLISPIDGKIIKFTTFTTDNPPTLEKGKMYTIYNSFLQGFQTKTGKVELNINIKPENVYPEKVALTQKQESLVEDARASIYRTAVHPTDYKPFAESPPKPRKTSPVSDPAVATTIENGEVIVITKSGRRIPSREYQKEYGLVKPKEKVGVAYDEKTLRQIEEEMLDEDQLFMMGLLPIGALGMSQIGLPGDQPGWGLQPPGITADARTQEEKMLAVQQAMQRNREQFIGIVSAPVELGDIWYRKAAEAHERIKARDEAAPKDRSIRGSLAASKYHLTQMPWNLLDAASGLFYPLAYPMQAAWGMAGGMSPMEGIRQEVTPSGVLGIDDPLAALAADIAGDPINLVFLPSFAKKTGMKAPEMLGAIRKTEFSGFRRFLADESATGFLSGRDLVKQSKEYLETLAARGQLHKYNYKDYGLTSEEFSQIAELAKALPSTIETKKPSVQKKGLYAAWQSWSRQERALQSDLLSQEYERSRMPPPSLEETRTWEQWNRLLKGEPLLEKGFLTQKEIRKQYPREWEDYTTAVIPIDRTDETRNVLDIGTYPPADSRVVNVNEFLEQARKRKEFAEDWAKRRPEPAPPMTEADKQAYKAFQDATDMEVPPPRRFVARSDLDIGPATREQAGIPPPASPSGEAQVSKEAGVSLRELWRKRIQLGTGGSGFPWGTAALAGAGLTSIGVGVYSLAGSLKKDQEEAMKSVSNSMVQGESRFVLPDISYPMKYPPTMYPVPMPVVGADEPITAMADVLGSPAKQDEDEEKSLLGKVFDALQTVSYLEGAAITGMKSVLESPGDLSKWTYEWGITPSEALGIKSKDASLLSWEGFAGTALDIVIDPTTWLSFGTGAAARIGTKAGTSIALNPRGFAALREFTEAAARKGISRKEAEAMFADTLSDPAVAKQFEPSAGLVLRGWGALSSYEYERTIQTKILSNRYV